MSDATNRPLPDLVRERAPYDTPDEVWRHIAAARNPDLTPDELWYYMTDAERVRLRIAELRAAIAKIRGELCNIQGFGLLYRPVDRFLARLLR